MSIKLTTAEACFELCRGAHICVSHYTNCKRPVITLSNPAIYKYATLGTITEKQFIEIDESCSIKCIEQKENKYGHVHNFYVVEDWILKDARAEFLKRKKENK